jgi:hypothetical protein
MASAAQLTSHLPASSELAVPAHWPPPRCRCRCRCRCRWRIAAVRRQAARRGSLRAGASMTESTAKAAVEPPAERMKGCHRNIRRRVRWHATAVDNERVAGRRGPGASVRQSQNPAAPPTQARTARGGGQAVDRAGGCKFGQRHRKRNVVPSAAPSGLACCESGLIICVQMISSS